MDLSTLSLDDTLESSDQPGGAHSAICPCSFAYHLSKSVVVERIQQPALGTLRL